MGLYIYIPFSRTVIVEGHKICTKHGDVSYNVWHGCITKANDVAICHASVCVPASL